MSIIQINKRMCSSCSGWNPSWNRRNVWINRIKKTVFVLCLMKCVCVCSSVKLSRLISTVSEKHNHGDRAWQQFIWGCHGHKLWSLFTSNTLLFKYVYWSDLLNYNWKLYCSEVARVLMEFLLAHFGLIFHFRFITRN